MATKRSANCRSKVYSFSEDSDDAIQLQPVKRQRRNVQSNVDESYNEKSTNFTRQRNISPRNGERFKNVNRNTTAMSQYSDSKQSGFSRNAILARENRIKKKMYLSELENQAVSLKSENKKLRTTIGTQSNYITDLEKEINYLKSVLANAKEIGLLLRSVHASTGLPVTTSMKNRWSKNGKSEERNMPISLPQTANTWKSVREDNEAAKIDNNRHIVTPPASISSMSPHHQYSPIYEPSSPLNLDVTSYLSDDDFFVGDVTLPQFLSLDDDVFGSPLETSEPAATKSPRVNSFENACNDHTYSSSLNMFPDFKPANVGVCFHISNQKVSLEFCATCNEKASSNWEIAKP